MIHLSYVLPSVIPSVFSSVLTVWKLSLFNLTCVFIQVFEEESINRLKERHRLSIIDHNHHFTSSRGFEILNRAKLVVKYHQITYKLMLWYLPQV